MDAPSSSIENWSLVRTEDPFIPTTIQELFAAEKQEFGLKYKVHGTFSGSFTLFGQVKVAKESGTIFIYEMFDSSGSVEVHHLTTNLEAKLIEIGKSIYCVGRRLDKEGKKIFEAFGVFESTQEEGEFFQLQIEAAKKGGFAKTKHVVEEKSLDQQMLEHLKGFPPGTNLSLQDIIGHFSGKFSIRDIEKSTLAAREEGLIYEVETNIFNTI